jgi:hypothetical protein
MTSHTPAKTSESPCSVSLTCIGVRAVKILDFFLYNLLIFQGVSLNLDLFVSDLGHLGVALNYSLEIENMPIITRCGAVWFQIPGLIIINVENKNKNIIDARLQYDFKYQV